MAEPWQMTAKEWGDRAERLTEQEDAIREDLARTMGEDVWDPNAPIGREASQKALAILRERTGDPTLTGSDLAGSGHKASVRQALAASLPVPPKVLADYPDLAAKVKSKSHTLVKITQPQGTDFQKGHIVHQDYAEAINAIAHDKGDAPALYRIVRKGEVPKIRVEDPGDIGFLPGYDQPAAVFDELSAMALDEGRVPPIGRDPAELMLEPEEEELYQKTYGEGTIGNPGNNPGNSIRQIAIDAGVSEDYVRTLMAAGYSLDEITEKLAMQGPTTGNPGHNPGNPGTLEERIKALEEKVDRLSGPHIELVEATIHPEGTMEGPHAELVAAEGPPPGQSVAEWISRLGGSPGILVDPGIARATPCIMYNLGEGRRPLVYSKGIIGALDDEQKELYCQEGLHTLPLTPKQQARLEAMEQGSRRCSELTDGQPPEVRIPSYFSCLGQELRKKGAEPW